MVQANIRYTRNWTWARILVRVEGWLVVVSRIYRYNEVGLLQSYLRLQLHEILWNERGDMAALLSKAGKDLTVTVLLDVLQQTKDFELYILIDSVFDRAQPILPFFNMRLMRSCTVDGRCDQHAHGKGPKSSKPKWAGMAGLLEI